jgi:hypothetical protein
MTLSISGLFPSETYIYSAEAREPGCSHVFYVLDGTITSDSDGNGELTLTNNLPGEVEFTYTLQDTNGGISANTVIVEGTGDMTVCCDAKPKIPEDDGDITMPVITIPTNNPITVDGSCVINALCAVLTSIDNGVLNSGGYTNQAVQVMLNNLAASTQAQVDAYAASVDAANAASQAQINELLSDICMKSTEVLELLPGTTV